MKYLFLSSLSFLIFFLPLLHSFLAETPPPHPPQNPSPIPPNVAAPSTKTVLDRLRAHPPPKRAVTDKLSSAVKKMETPSRSASPARAPEYVSDSRARSRASSHVEAELTHFSTPRASMYAVEPPSPLSTTTSAATIQEEETPSYIHSTEMAKLRVGEVKRGRKVVRPFH